MNCSDQLTRGWSLLDRPRRGNMRGNTGGKQGPRARCSPWKASGRSARLAENRPPVRDEQKRQLPIIAQVTSCRSRAAHCAARMVKPPPRPEPTAIPWRERPPEMAAWPAKPAARDGVALYHLIRDQMIRDQSEGGVPCGSCGNRSVVSKERWARSVRPRLRQRPQADRRESVSPGRSVENTRGRSRDSSARRGSVSRRSVRGACPVGNRAK